MLLYVAKNISDLLLRFNDIAGLMISKRIILNQKFASENA